MDIKTTSSTDMFLRTMHHPDEEMDSKTSGCLGYRARFDGLRQFVNHPTVTSEESRPIKNSHPTKKIADRREVRATCHKSQNDNIAATVVTMNAQPAEWTTTQKSSEVATSSSPLLAPV
ncbi:hypothetical protein PROFUN_07789 [Planoprotostelium fungivorum]|uniref:Uncharacterized protein n=1 Tax=Planoprotostelium fungivorum TaxID=1890364 RepID=A0A2P6MX51_9EUKA|nr:hypothetical protein PROFUN_07789 [Planoprotostelium fungivorum]